MVDAESFRRLSGGAADELHWLLYFWTSAYVSDFLAQITRLSPLLFYLLFGTCFSNFGITGHSEVMPVLSEVAITLVFFALGFEENVEHFLGGVKKAWGIATIGAIVPFFCGFGCAQIFFPEEGMKPAMMMGLSVTATAVSLTMITLKSKGLETSKAAIGIMTSAVLDDVMALVLVAIMVPIASGTASPTVEGILAILGKTVLFFLMIAVFHVVVFPHDLSSVPVLKKIPFIRSVGIHNLLSFHSGEQAVLVSLGVGLGVGLLAVNFGFHPAIGAYMAGLILDKEYFEIPANGHGGSHNCYEHVKEILENAAFVWLGPIFFIHLGTDIKIDPDIVSSVIVETLVIFIVVFIGQILAAAFAARYVPGGFSWQESIMIGFGMLGRAELFFVVLDICYNQYPIFSQKMFYSLTFAAVLLNISVPVTISIYTPYYLGEKVCCGARAVPAVEAPEILMTGPSSAEPPEMVEVGGSSRSDCDCVPWRRSRYGRRRFF
mmetsp:Transcript_13861/g.25865  ORF Transcript_13861/g.25865 Transcript_13861/m.25865 type:complete len:491 (-) Transcript_13861:47-1519(-)